MAIMSLLKRLGSCGLVMLMSACLGGSYTPVGKVVKVKTGDQVIIPMTFIDPHSPPRDFQLLAIQCPDPEDDKNLAEAYYGVLARSLTESWVEGRTVTLVRPLVKPGGLMDRSTGWIKDPKTGEYLHEVLLKAGLARGLSGDGELGEIGARIVQLEAQARSQGLGMFSATRPSEARMTQVIKESSLVGQLTGVLRPKTVPDTTTTTVVPDRTSPTVVPNGSNPSVVPDQTTPAVIPHQPVPRQTTPPSSVQDLLMTLNSETDQARREFLAWQSLPADQRGARSAALRSQLRALKIRLMDITDEVDSLDEVQRGFLEGLREEMNRLMRLIPKS